MYTRSNLNPQALAALQQQTSHQPQQAYELQTPPHQPQDPRIREVWLSNLKTEMANLRTLVDDHGYTYIAMDTEFPGIVARPVGAFTTKADYHYQTLRCNVDLLKMIQLGITLFKPDGTLPTDPRNTATLPPSLHGVCTWQFNFSFSLQTDMYAASSTTMLSLAGLDFKRHETQGIDPFKFAALLISSGLALAPEVKWISFHSGYDFGYLMKVMLNKELPDTEREFHILLSKFFPSLFDIKFIVKQLANAQANRAGGIELSQEASRIIQVITQKSGLQDLATELGIARIGVQHQAGSDSLLTGQVYFKMKEKIFAGNLDEQRYRGQVWGLNGQVAMYAPQNLQTGGPSTPQTSSSGLVGMQHTPGHGFGTPGGFGNFQYSGSSGLAKG
ncbi:hypothetical protein BT93_L5525 [Corymbia citriodora subsp. variegata]|uniref:poly(A)-specific ribonuclease n=1 Tax=Corymbia citriodora subsp. variegata TaxID=360336 RepID=A0A8T0CF44_CORYI|nr:hypothetical protein BT93_L5525 [Corymbia citriodora subsp. variegata]